MLLLMSGREVSMGWSCRETNSNALQMAETEWDVT